MVKDTPLTAEQVAAAREMRLEAQALQVLEGNPLSEDQIAMFEMFEREAWSHDKRLAYILARSVSLAAE